jgi:hypothetical protein
MKPMRGALSGELCTASASKLDGDAGVPLARVAAVPAADRTSAPGTKPRRTKPMPESFHTGIHLDRPVDAMVPSTPKEGKMTTAVEQSLIDKLRDLPPDKLNEVEDFVDFLRQRLDERTLARASAKLSESAFAKVWDNPDDAEYDRL